MPLAYPRRALAAGAVLAAACLALAGAAAQADQVRGEEWWLAALHVRQAWQSSRGAGVTVAVLGTGVDPRQPDLAGSVISGPDYTASGRVPGGPFWGFDGSEAASLIAGHGHGRGDRDGIIGIAPAARILSIRVTLEGDDPLLADPSIAGSLPDAIARGIRYAVRHHAAVIDLPLDPAPTPGSPGAGGSPAERSAVAYALANHVVLLAPAGDDGQAADAVDFPAAYPGVISVGAFDSSFAKAAFSSQQPYVTLTAPGAGVVAAEPGSAYATVNSTTAASAVAAGIAALIRAQFPQLTPAQVEQALTQGTIHHRRDGRRDGSGHGTADAAAALAAAARISEAIPSPAPSATATASAAQAPEPPAVHISAAPSLGRMVTGDVIVAAGVFAALIAAILGWGRLQRRRARAARLAQVRAAARVPVGSSQAATGRKTRLAGSGKSANAGDGGAGATSEASAASVTAAGHAGMAGGVGGAAGKRVPANSGGARTPAASIAGAAADGMDPWRMRPDGAALPSLFQNTLFARSIGSGEPGDGAGSGDDARFGDGAGSGDDARSGNGAGSGDGAEFGDGAGSGDGAEFGDGDGSGDEAGADGAGSVLAAREPARTVISGVVIEGIADRGQAGPSQGGAAISSGAVGPAGAGPSVTGGGGIAAMRALSANRMGPARPPKVTGSPPWEPAAQPDGDVPSARPELEAGAAEGFSRLPHRKPKPELSAWDVLAQEVWPGGPGGSREGARPVDVASPPQTAAPGRVSVWNPGAITETFPAIRQTGEDA